METNKTIQAWTALDKTQAATYSNKLWLEAANKLKPGELLRAKFDEKRGLIPIRLKRPSFFKGIWARIKDDPWFKEYRICLRNTELCVNELMHHLDNKHDKDSLHTSLHLLRSLSEDRELRHTIGKRKVQGFQSKILHELLEQLTPHIDFQGEKELLEKQALYALASSNSQLFKKIKKDPRFPLIRSEMLTIDHIKSQREWHKRRIKKVESFIRHLSQVSHSCDEYRKAFRSLLKHVDHSSVLNEEEKLELHRCFSEYELIQHELFSLSSLYEEILNPAISKLSPRELDHLVSRFGLSFEKAAMPVFFHLKQTPLLEASLFQLLKKIQKDQSCVQGWWDSLDDDFKCLCTPWDTKEVPLCTHFTKQFCPCEPILRYLDQYLNELMGLKLVMQKGCLAEKSLSQCVKSLFQLSRMKCSCEKAVGAKA